MTLGTYLRIAREQAREQDRAFSLRKVAQRVGIEPAYLSKIERGETPPPSEATIRRLAEELHEKPDLLLAMAGKVSRDLQDIILHRPQLFAELLRQLKDAPDHAILSVVKEVRDGDWLGRGLRGGCQWAVGAPVFSSPENGCYSMATMTTRRTNRQGSAETTREESVNVLLAQLLRNRGMSAKAERRSREGVPDIRVKLTSDDLIILECKWEGSAELLENQLQGRLEGFSGALGTIGLLYPDRLRYAEDTLAELESASDLQWWVHGSHGAATHVSHFRTGSVADLADQLRILPLELEGVDRVSAAAVTVKYALEQATKQLTRHARISHRIAEIIAQTDKEKDRAAALQIGCLVLFNALAFQDRLAAANESVPTVREALGRGIPGLHDAWRSICDNIDYVPVFELAAEILDVLDDGPDEVQAPVIDPLVRAVNDTRKLEGHDLSGRLFHTLLTDAKFTGAYYTSVPAATLLARLVFHGWPANVDWQDYEFPASINVADLACGTGTLLMAVATEAERLHTSTGGRNAPELHKAMVEKALHGYDVQLSAVHFAATSLAMLNPDIQFDRMNLYVMPLGAEGPNISLGSLDFLGSDEAAVQFALSAEDLGVTAMDAERVSGGGSQGAREGITAKLPNLDLVIMNPPFNRSVGGNLLFGSLPPAERRKLQNELSRRLKPMAGYSRQASATAGLGSAFVAAASPKLRPGEGRMALVLPGTVCTGPSWAQTRALIERDFTLDTVITSHDPQRWNFSDSTDLSESLLIATRRADDDDRTERRTTFVNLWRNPDGVLDAHRAAQAIVATTPARLEETGTALLVVDGLHVGEAISVPETRIRSRKWVGVQFARADLIRSALRLLDDGEVWVPGGVSTGGIPLCRLGALGQIGPDRRDVWDGFKRTDSITAYPMVENHDTEQRKRLVAEPDCYLAPLTTPQPGRHLKPIAQLWPKAGRLLVAERLWLETTRVVAMWSEERVLSNVWWPTRVEDVLHEKALAVWLNSSLGLLTILAQRTSTRGGWIAMKKADLEELPVLDVRQLSASQVQGLSRLFDEMAESEFERLSGMAHCPARCTLDHGVSEILGLPDLAKLRDLLASEPVVSNRRL